MTGRRLLWAAAAIVGAAAAAAIVVALVPGGAPAIRPPANGMIIASSNDRTALFGDTVHGRVDVVVDRRRIDPATVEVEPSIGNWLATAAPTVSRSDSGAATHLVYGFSFRCLALACLPPDPEHEGRQLVPIPPARLTLVGPDGRRHAHLVRWRRVEVSSRISPVDLAHLTPVDQLPFHATIAVPAASYRISPTALVALCAVAGGLLVALAGLLVVRFARKPAPVVVEPEHEPAPVRELTPLERALLLLERARERGGVPDQRKALENLAGELRQTGEGDLAGSATVLAWAEPPPSPDRTGALAAAVQRRIDEDQNGHHED